MPDEIEATPTPFSLPLLSKVGPVSGLLPFTSLFLQVEMGRLIQKMVSIFFFLADLNYKYKSTVK